MGPGDKIGNRTRWGLPGSRPDAFTHANPPSPPRRCACRNARRSGRCPAMANARAHDRDWDAGGRSPDFVSRLLAERLSERLGQAVVVENSATTGVATWNTVAKSQPDGYLVSMLTGAFSARAAVAK